MTVVDFEPKLPGELRIDRKLADGDKQAPAPQPLLGFTAIDGVSRARLIKASPDEQPAISRSLNLGPGDLHFILQSRETSIESEHLQQTG